MCITCCGHIVLSRDDTNILSPYGCINFGMITENTCVIGITCIQTVSGDYNIALPYLKAAKVSCLILRLGCRKVAREALIKPPPLTAIPAGLAITTSARRPPTSI
ncbi:hypothetical protein NM1476_0533 [Neisseria meningitidis NM1476]|nr:hypothetical protein NM1476_0533 [Neisseria meningitidis NM1476]